MDNNDQDQYHCDQCERDIPDEENRVVFSLNVEHFAKDGSIETDDSSEVAVFCLECFSEMAKAGDVNLSFHVEVEE